LFHPLQETRTRQVRRASRGFRPVVKVVEVEVEVEVALEVPLEVPVVVALVVALVVDSSKDAENSTTSNTWVLFCWRRT